MTTLILGANGATGKLLVEQLLLKGQSVKVIVRDSKKLPESWKANNMVTIIEASVLDISEDSLVKYLAGCNAVASCLGHNLTFKGLYGKPRRLVADAVRNICNAIKVSEKSDLPIKFVLMNTSGNQNRDLNESISLGEKIVIGLIRLLLPPHSDNEAAADYLRLHIGQKDENIEWVAVRPDNLEDEEKVTPYEAFPSPIRSAIFNPGITSRINVGSFMAELITDSKLWDNWKGQMPVLYNKSST